VREAQKSPNRPERMQQRRAMMALAPRTDQRIPDCFRRSPMTVRQPASTTPEPAKLSGAYLMEHGLPLFLEGDYDSTAIKFDRTSP
jgi:hypothetical protein